MSNYTILESEPDPAVQANAERLARIEALRVASEEKSVESNRSLHHNTLDNFLGNGSRPMTPVVPVRTVNTVKTVRRQRNSPEVPIFMNRYKLNRNTLKATHPELKHLFRNNSANSIYKRGIASAKAAAIRTKSRINAAAAAAKRRFLPAPVNVVPKINNNQHIPTTTMNAFLKGPGSGEPVYSKRASDVLGLDENISGATVASVPTHNNGGNNNTNITRAAQLKRRTGGTRRRRI